MSTSASGRRRRSRMKLTKVNKPAVNPMELVGFEGSRHLVPERLPSARKEKTVGIRVIELTKGALENIKEMGPSLRRLNLSDLRLAKLNEEVLTCLRSLEKFELDNNELTEEGFPTALAKVERLVELSVEQNKLTAFPHIMRKLKELKRLKLGSNRIASLEGIERLKRLQILMLDNNQLESLPREVFQNLKKLEILHVANNKIKEIHPDVRFLRYLKDVSFGGNKLTSLPSELLLLPRLEVLNASGNRISRVPTINVKGRGQRKLASIDLSCNVLLKFPEHLLAMSEKLDLCRNRIKSIPASMLKKIDTCCEQEVLISDNPLVSPPLDICECGVRSIVQYFQEAKTETKVYQGLKVLVLGASGCGKTSLIQTLLDQQPRLTPEGDVTVGVDMYDLDYDIEISDPVLEDVSGSSDDEEDAAHSRQKPKIPLKSLQLSVWDFSGHTQYLLSHYYFLHDPALVMLVFNMADYEEDKFKQKLGFWIDFVLSKTHKIIMMPVGTMADQVSPERVAEICQSVHRQINDFIVNLKKTVELEIKKIERLPHIPYTLSEQLKQYLRLMKVQAQVCSQVLPVSCQDYEGIEELLTAMKDIALNKELFPNVMRVIPSRWCEVEDYIEERAWTMDVPFMRWETYCEEVTKRFGMKHLMVPITQYLHDVGKVIWYASHNRLKEFVFLRPSWLADVVKHVFRHNVGEIDYSMEENFKHSGLAVDKFHKLTKTIVEEGHVDRDYLKGAWAGLVPHDSTKAVVEVMVILLEYFELGYPILKQGHKEVRMSLTPSLDNPRHPERSDSMNSLVSTKAEDLLQQTSTESMNAKSAKASKKKVKRDEPPPLPKINKIAVPFMRNVPKSKKVEAELYNYEDHLSITPVYKFPHFCPPGFFETMCVRVLKPPHDCRVVSDWQGGMYARFNNTSENPYFLLLESVQDEEQDSVWIRVQVRHTEYGVQESETEQMWGALLPYLKDVEDLLEKFLGAHLQRFLECPRCGALDGFIGEWLTPKELQGLSHKTCSRCEEDVPTMYLIQPKEKKRVEEFLLRKLKREAEKRQSNMTMEQIKEETANGSDSDQQPSNHNDRAMSSADLKPATAMNDQETTKYHHNGYNSMPNGEASQQNGFMNGDHYPPDADNDKENGFSPQGPYLRGNSARHKADGVSPSPGMDQSEQGIGSPEVGQDHRRVVRPKSRQSPPAGKYLVRDLEEQKYLVNLPTLNQAKVTHRNLQTD